MKTIYHIPFNDRVEMELEDKLYNIYIEMSSKANELYEKTYLGLNTKSIELEIMALKNEYFKAKDLYDLVQSFSTIYLN